MLRRTFEPKGSITVIRPRSEARLARTLFIAPQRERWQLRERPVGRGAWVILVMLPCPELCMFEVHTKVCF